MPNYIGIGARIVRDYFCRILLTLTTNGQVCYFAPGVHIVRPALAKCVLPLTSERDEK